MYSINWLSVAVFMLVFGIIGNGVVGHRLVAHKQFEPAHWIRGFLYLLCTLAAFSPVWFWRAQHWHHHKFSDQDADVHSPITKSFWYSFFWWAMKQESVRTVLRTEGPSVRESFRDPAIKFLASWNYKIIWLFIIVLGTISPALVLAYFIFFWIEIIRLGALSTLMHLKLPFSYRNFETDEHSQNNVILGHLTFGLGWHNNHHMYPKRLDNQIKWWEFDLEAKLSKLIALIPGKR